ncbi:MAG: N-acetylmuramoyl-L-alanine amidase [Acidobacteriaceae bacterium]
MLLCASCLSVAALATRQSAALSPFARAERMREALEGQPESQRTRRDYERVLSAYRAVYHENPGSPHAAAAVDAVASLLAEEGRVFEDQKTLRDAIGQYEFLRHAYPGSRQRVSALLDEGEVYHRDLNDGHAAKLIFEEFLRSYPHSPLAREARAELRVIRREAASPQPATPTETAATQQPAAATATVGSVAKGGEHARHHTVLDAALASQSSGQKDEPHLAPQPSVSDTRRAAGTPTRKMTGRPVQGNELTRLGEPSIHSAPTPETGSDTGSEPQPAPKLSEAAMTAPPPLRHGRLPLVTGVRHWSTPVYTRVAIDLQDQVQYEAARVPNPDRIYFDLHGAKIAPELIGKSVDVTDDGFLKRIRVAQFSNDVTRIVLDVSQVSEYSAFFLPNPWRLIIDIHGSGPERPRTTNTPPVQIAQQALPAPDHKPLSPPANGKLNSEKTTAAAPVSATSSPGKSTESGARANAPQATAAQSEDEIAASLDMPTGVVARSRRRSSQNNPAQNNSAQNTSAQNNAAQSNSAQDIASLGQQPNRVKATRRPTTAPIAATVAGTTQASQPERPIELAPGTSTSSVATDDGEDITPPPATTASNAVPANAPDRNTARRRGGTHTTVSAGDVLSPASREATPTADGQRSLVRALGLKIGRIVVDAGHGGHDSGTLGPGGIEEKEVVLDVALRLGKLLKQRLGADVIYTRDDDTFIPLETRTAIANKAQADLFISVHANSSADPSARGVETYYLNFTTSPEALEVAARENAVSGQSIHELSDLVKKIALKDKIDESREFAADVEGSLYNGLESGNIGLRDRGVKKAPFVVLIGANMPSILAEISFLTNPDDAEELHNPVYRERIAESLYRGVAKYINGLSGLRLAQTTGRTAGE